MESEIAKVEQQLENLKTKWKEHDFWNPEMEGELWEHSRRRFAIEIVKAIHSSKESVNK